MAVTRSGKDKLMRNMRIYAGAYDLSGDARSFDEASCNIEDVEMTGWSDATMQWGNGGRRTVQINGFTALMNDTTGRAFDILKNTPQNMLLSLHFGGGGEPDVGDPCYAIGAVQMGDQVTVDTNKMILTANFMPTPDYTDDQQQSPFGYVISGASTTYTTTFSGSSVDLTEGDTGKTISGCYAILHVIDADTGGTWSIRVEHSTDDAAFSTKMTFTINGSALTAERISSTGTVNRYVRLAGTGTGTTGAKFACSFVPVWDLSTGG